MVSKFEGQYTYNVLHVSWKYSQEEITWMDIQTKLGYNVVKWIETGQY